MTDNAPAKRPAFEPAERLLRPVRYDPEMKRPLSTVAGAVLVLLRAVVGVLWIGELVLNWKVIAAQASIVLTGADAAQQAGLGLALIVAVIGVVMLAEVVLAVFILRGHNWPRVIVMFVAVISISTSFAAWWADSLEITLFTSLPSIALDVLVLLALSSRSAAAYARRNEPR